MDAERLSAIEQRLMDLARSLPPPLEAASSPPALAAALLTRRALKLFEGSALLLELATEVPAVVLVRPLVELTIKLTWIAVEPERNAELWFLQSEDADLRTLRAVDMHLGPRKERAADTEAVRAAREHALDDARAEAAAAGRPYAERLTPNVEQMVDEIARAFPGQRYRMRQAYELGFRTFSPWVHSEAASFKNDLDDSGSEVRFVGDRGPLAPEHLRLVDASLFAHSLGVGSAMMGLDAMSEEAMKLAVELGGPADT